jgi:hypothetical protein
MKCIFALLLINIIAFCGEINSQNPLRVVYKNKYCGGARPSPEIIDQYNIPKIFSNSKLRFISKERKKVYCLNTDDKGNVQSEVLKPGKYGVYLHKKSTNENGAQFDKKCKENFKIELAIIEIIPNASLDSVILQFPCIPCENIRE